MSLGGASYDEAAATAASAGGYVVVGNTTSFGAGGEDVLAAGIGADGSNCFGGGGSFAVKDASILGDMAFPSSYAAPMAVTEPALEFFPFVPAETTLCVSSVSEPRGAGGPLVSAVRLVSGGLVVSVASPARVTVYSADGHLVRALYVHKRARVALRAGVYFVRSEGGETLRAVVAR